MSDFNTAERLLESIKNSLDKKNIYELRQIGRAVGVFRPTDMKKEFLINDILLIAQNRLDKTVPNKRGAPAKSDVYDKQIVDDILRCREIYSGTEIIDYPLNMLEVTDNSDKTEQDYISESVQYCGVLDFVDGGSFLRVNNLKITPEKDALVPTEFIKEYDLRAGDKLTVKAAYIKSGHTLTVTSIIAVNGVRPDMLNSRPHFESFAPYYGDKAFELNKTQNPTVGKIISLFAPITNGARVIVSAPPKTGKTTLLKQLAASLIQCDNKLKVIYTAIAERPEEITDTINFLPDAEVAYSTFDMGEAYHVHTAILALERAKRLVEEGKNVVLILDGLTRTVHACNTLLNANAAYFGELNANAFLEAKKLFGAARNVKDGGSLTVICSAEILTGNPVDDIIYRQFKDAATVEIILNKSLAENKIFPAIDIRESYAIKMEKLLSKALIDLSVNLKKIAVDANAYKQIYNLLNNSQSNEELLKNAKTLLGE